MLRRLALAALLALAPSLASAQFATIGPTQPVTDNGDRLATTAWINNYLANGLPLASGKIWIGSIGGLATPQTPSGDWTIDNSGVSTLATVSANVGTFGSATQCVTVTNNAKGLTTAISAATCTPAIGSISGLGTGISAALAVNVGTAGSPVINGGVLGTPSSGTLTNATGLPISTGVSGLGTGVATALGTAANASGGFPTVPVGNSALATMAGSSVKGNVSTSFGAPSDIVCASNAVVGMNGTTLGCQLVLNANIFSGAAITLSKLANGSANTIVGSLTAAAHTDLAVPSCSAASQALQWVSGTGLQCATFSTTTTLGSTTLTLGSTSSTLQMTGTASQYSSAIVARAPASGSSFEWGHSNASGFASTMGNEVGSGASFIAFSAGPGTTSNTYKTFGVAGSLIKSDNAGGWVISTIPTASADNQTPQQIAALNTKGHFNIGNGTPTINSCSTGTVTANSTDTIGEATATGATSCAINFANGYALAPFCVASDATRAAVLQVSATTSVLTVSGLTAGDVFHWFCGGRVGGL